MSHLGERKTDMCISCSESFVFIVEPPAADVCIRGGEVCMGGPSSMPNGHLLEDKSKKYSPLKSWVLRALSFKWKPFGRLDFVFHAIGTPILRFKGLLGFFL